MVLASLLYFFQDQRIFNEIKQEKPEQKEMQHVVK